MEAPHPVEAARRTITPPEETDGDPQREQDVWKTGHGIGRVRIGDIIADNNIAPGGTVITPALEPQVDNRETLTSGTIGGTIFHRMRTRSQSQRETQTERSQDRLGDDLSTTQVEGVTIFHRRQTRSQNQEGTQAEGHRDRLGDDPEEDATQYVIERIVDHDDSEGELWFRIRWYGYRPTDDTWEPIDGIPRNLIVAYYKRIREAPPPDQLLRRALQG